MPPNKKVGSYNQAGNIFPTIQINEQNLIKASMVEKCAFSLRKWKQAGKVVLKFNKQPNSIKGEHGRKI